MSHTMTETTTTTTTTRDENASPTDRSTFLSKVRSRFAIGRKSRDSNAVPSKTDPYRKARSMDLAHQPFISQPALVNRVPRAPDRDPSTDSANTPPSSGLPNSAGHVGDQSRRYSQSRVVFQLRHPLETASVSSKARPTIEGLPSSRDAGAVLGLSSSASEPGTGRPARLEVSTTPDAEHASPAFSLPPIQPGSPISLSSPTQPSHAKAAPSSSKQSQVRNHMEHPSIATVLSPPAHAPAADGDMIKDSSGTSKGQVTSSTSTQSASSETTRKAPTSPRKPTRDDVPPILLRRGLTSQPPASKPAHDPHSIITEEARDDSQPGPSSSYPLAPPSLGALPGRPLSRIQLTGGARLSPAITMRASAMPLPPLPALPPPTPAEASNPTRPNASTRLRSMPTLARMTAGEEEEDETIADHENAMLEEEEDEDNHESPEPEETREPARTPGPRLDLTGFRKPSRMRSGSGIATNAGMDVTTPRASRIMDYFSLKSPVEKKAKTPAVLGPEGTPPNKKQPPVKATAPGEAPAAAASEDAASSSGASTADSAPSSPMRTPRPQDTLFTHKSPDLSQPRPVIAHHASKSMVDLLSPRAERLQALVAPEPGASDRLPAVEGESVLRRREREHNIGAHSLKRRSSMPHYNVNSPPPPYPEFGPHPSRFRVTPREDEGRERLPAYQNTIHLRAVMPRKVEFTAPGVQAHDRKWRRVLCELEGTVFRVYKCPAAAVGVGPITSWWERRVGVGDVAVDAPARDAAPGTGGGTIDASGRIRGITSTANGGETRLEPAPKLGEDQRPSVTVTAAPAPVPEPVPVPTPAPTHGRSKSGSRFFGRKSSSLPEAGRSSLSVNLIAQANSINDRRSSLSTSGRPSMSSARTSSGSTEELPPPGSAVPEPVPEDLIRAYTLQHAESGLGSDYAKRKNVIRVRMEGEQFLLQAQDVASVIDWIEGLQAATNIALDLDERPMPRGPLFPRRRRRRIRRPEAGQGGDNANNGSGNGGTSNSSRPREPGPSGIVTSEVRRHG